MQYTMWMTCALLICQVIGVSSDKIPCKDKKLDVVVIFDESSSIPVNDFELEKDFVKGLVDALNIGLTKTRLGALSFNEEGRVYFHLKDHGTANDIKMAIMNIKQAGGLANIAMSLMFADDPLLLNENGNREEFPDIVILISAGFNAVVDKQNVIDAAYKLKNKGVTVVTAGVGDATDLEFLNEIASGSQYIHVAPSFADLANDVPEVAGKICSDEIVRAKSNRVVKDVKKPQSLLQKESI